MHQQRTVSQHVDDILQHGIVQPCASPRGAPIVLVKKKDGTTGLCVDYRKLNDVTREDAYPVHRWDSFKMFTSLQMASGYRQVEVDIADRGRQH